jgi:hypothetical protein
MSEIKLVERPLGERVTILFGHVLMLQQSAERIEAKLDTLISALAEDDQDERPAHDLEGNPLPAERDPDEPL